MSQYQVFENFTIDVMAELIEVVAATAVAAKAEQPAVCQGAAGPGSNVARHVEKTYSASIQSSADRGQNLGA